MPAACANGALRRVSRGAVPRRVAHSAQLLPHPPLARARLCYCCCLLCGRLVRQQQQQRQRHVGSNGTAQAAVARAPASVGRRAAARPPLPAERAALAARARPVLRRPRDHRQVLRSAHCSVSVSVLTLSYSYCTMIHSWSSSTRLFDDEDEQEFEFEFEFEFAELVSC